MIDEGVSQIVQMVVILFSDEDVNNHLFNLNRVAQPLLGWMYDDDVYRRGYLMEDDCPSYLSQEDKVLLISHYPMWSAVDRKVHELGKPLPPVGSFKHFQQYNYNKSKWGLDKSTEFSCRVLTEGIKVCFEALYILRHIHSLVVTTWRHDQSRVIKPFIIQFASNHNGTGPLTSQIRKKLNNIDLPLTSFVYNFGIELLRYLGSERFSRAQLFVPCHRISHVAAGQNTELERIEDMSISRQIDSFARDGKWPLKSHRVITFATIPELDSLRTHHSVLYQHSISHLPLNKNGKRAKVKCSLCSNGTTFRQTSKECSSCRVPLCTQPIDGEKSCFALWHEGDDLKGKHVRVLELLKMRKADNPAQRKKPNGTELVGFCNDIGESIDEGNSESQFHHDGQDDNSQEGDDFVGNTQKEVDESDDELFNTKKSASEYSGRKQRGLESSPSSVDESVHANAASMRPLSGDIFLDDESDDSSTG
jgi:hypothetical protein